MKDDFFEAFIEGMVAEGMPASYISKHIVKALERQEMGKNKMCALCQLSPNFASFLEKQADIYNQNND